MKGFLECVKEIEKYWLENDISQGYVSIEEARGIIDKLQLKQLCTMDLNNLYNFVGLYFDNKLLSMRINNDNNFDKYMKLNDCKSAITYLIKEYLIAR